MDIPWLADLLASGVGAGAAFALGCATVPQATGTVARGIEPNRRGGNGVGHVVVIGAGIWGSWTAYHLRKRGARVTLIDKQNRVIEQLGEAGIDSWKELRGGPRENFPVGKFVCPHSACFDHEGNIFVVEWVEVGRVTKLRRV